MDADLDTLATALYVRTDDLFTAHPDRVPPRPRVGITPQISDAELITLAVMQAHLGFTSEARWLRYARTHLVGMFPMLPQQSGYNKRLRKLAATMAWLVNALAAQTSIVTDDVAVAERSECRRRGAPGAGRLRTDGVAGTAPRLGTLVAARGPAVRTSQRLGFRLLAQVPQPRLGPCVGGVRRLR